MTCYDRQHNLIGDYVANEVARQAAEQRAQAAEARLRELEAELQRLHKHYSHEQNG